MEEDLGRGGDKRWDMGKVGGKRWEACGQSFR